MWRDFWADGGSEFNRGELSYVIGMGRNNDVLVLVGSTCQICRWWAHATCFGLCCGRQGFHEAMGQTGWDTDVLQCYTSLVGNDGKRGSTKCSARPSLLIWLSLLDSFPRDSKRFWRVPLVETSRKTAMAVSSLAKSLQQIAFRPGHGKMAKWQRLHGGRKPKETGHIRTPDQIGKDLCFPCFPHVFPRGSFLAGAPGEDHGSLDPSGVQRNWRQGRMASYGLIVSVEISPKMGGHWPNYEMICFKQFEQPKMKDGSTEMGEWRIENQPTWRIWSARSRHWSNNNSDIGCYPTQDRQNWWQWCFHHSIIDRTNQWCSYTGNWNKTSGDAGIMYYNVQTCTNNQQWIFMGVRQEWKPCFKVNHVFLVVGGVNVFCLGNYQNPTYDWSFLPISCGFRL